MGSPHREIDDRIARFIERQHIFFVATAPSNLDGHLNISPKGLDTFRILAPRRVAYLDLTGSGIETVAHLRDNGRITFMFCAFEGTPMIVRLHGRGRVVEPGDAEWDKLVDLFPDFPGSRSIIVADLDRVSSSCGYGVPLYEYRGERTRLTEWSAQKGEDGLERYRAHNNRTSIDGLAGLSRPGGAPGQP